MNTFWDERFSQASYVYGQKPNAFFKTCLDGLKAGNLLLPGEGEGRNAVYAAKSGWSVTCFDSSIMARKKALKLASANYISIDYHTHSYHQMNYSENSFDCIALIFTHMDAELRSGFHQQMIQFLRPGGHLILFGFSKNQLGKDSGGPKVPGKLWSEKELQQDFNQLIQIQINNFEGFLNEGEYHQGSASLISLTATKPKT